MWGKGQQQWGGASWGNQGAAKGGWNQGKGAAAQQKPTIKPAGQGFVAASGKAAGGPSAEQVKAKLTKLTAAFSTQETMMKPSLESATKALENEKPTAALLKSSMEALEKQQTKLNELKTEIIKECAEARKGGPAASSSAQDMSKLLIKCNSACQQVLVNLNKLKPKLTKAQNEVEMKAKEVKDAAAFKPVLAKATTDVNAAVNAVNAITKQVDPLVLKPPEEGEELDKKIANIEKVAEEAAKKCETARTELNEKMKAIQAYAPETKKKAQADLMELQKKLTENVRKCQIYKAFKKEFPKLVANQKAVVEVTEKLAGHEAAITKATKAAEKKDLTKDNVHSIDEALDPVLKAIKEANSTISAKMRLSDASTQEKLTKQKTRSEELKKKVDAVIEKIKVQRDIIKSKEGIDTAKERLEKLEAAWSACQDGEMPFLTGLEVLPDDVNESALKECNEALTAATQASSAAKTWVSEHLRDCKTYEKDLAKTTSDALNPISAQLRDIDSKVNTFRRETQERRVTSTVAKVLGPFDASVKSAEGAGKALASKDLEDETSKGIEEAIGKTKAAVAEANTQAQEARKGIEAKKKEGQFPGAAQGKVNQGFQDGQNKLHNLQSSIAKAEKLVKAKAAIPAGEEATKEAEASAEKAKALVPADGQGFTMEKIAALNEALAAASKTIQAANGVVQPHLNAAPPKTKAEFQKLVDRKKAAQEAVNKIKVDTKERREETLSTHYLEEAEVKTKATEAAVGKLDQAEGPFLVGASHDLKKTQEILAKCEEVASEVQAAVSASRQVSGQKAQEAKQFGEAGAKKVKEGLAAIAERVNKVSTRLTAFNKDHRERSKDSKMVEATEKVDALEETVKKTLAATAPFEKEGAETMSEADASVPLSAFMDLDKETRKQINAARSFVGEREKEQRGNATQVEAIKKLQERLTNWNKELAEKKKVTAVHEQRALGTRLLAESKEQVAGLDAEVKKATQACAALLEQGGQAFLVSACVRTLVSALKAHMEEKELTEDALFKAAGEGKKMKDKAFVKYLAGLSEAIGHDELSAFTEERRADIFKAVSADGKYITQEDFKAMFSQRHFCIKPVAVTNQFAVEGSETICKLEANGSSTVDVFGPTKEDASGMLRSECTVDGKKGWITLSQKKGPKFLTVSVPFVQFVKDAEKAVHAADQAVREASGSLNNKIGKSSKAEAGSRLKEVGEELAKLKEPSSKAQKEMQELSANFRKAKTEYSAKERTELTAHIVARNMKEAAPFVEGPKAKMEGLEAAAKAAEDGAAPMIALKPEELEAFATPASVLETVEKYAAEVVGKAAEVREAVKEQQKAVTEVTPQTSGTGEAKKQLAAISAKLHELENKCKKLAPILKNKCNSIVKAKLDTTSEGIRKHAQAKKLSPQELFDKLKDGDKIPEKAFCKLLQSLEGLSINAEHAKLICRKIEADGISNEAFTKFVVIYYKVLKTIAFTDAVDISKCKTLRKGEDNEIIEVLEGPQTVSYEGSEMIRIRGRGTAKNGTVTEGWLTVAGSKGTPFLQKVDKPPAAAPAKK